MKKRLLSASIILGVVLSIPLAHAATLSTLFASDNGGNFGGAVYFDIVVANRGIEITEFTTNTQELTPFTWEVFLTAAGGSAFGNETNTSAWTSVATGTGTGSGINLPSVVTLDNTFMLQANSEYGMGLIIGGAGHDYTNGNGINQAYSNADLSLSLGSASNVPFTSTVFNPRVWNGSIIYSIVPEPTSFLLLSGGGLLSLAWIWIGNRLSRRSAKRRC